MGQMKGPAAASAARRESPLMTADELAGWLHCSRRAVYDRVYRGQLPGVVRVGRRLHFMRDSVLAFLQQGTERRSWRSQ